MAIVTSALIKALQVGFRMDFEGSYKAAMPQWMDVAMKVPSSGRSSVYGWLGLFPSMAVWTGDRTYKDMKEHNYTLTNKKYQAAVKVSRSDIEDDQDSGIGIYRPLFMNMGDAAARFPDEHVFALLTGGLSNLCYDGQNFFDTEHPVYPKVDGTGTVVNTSNLSVPTAPAGTYYYWYLLDTTRPLKPLIYQERRMPNFQSRTMLTDEAVFTSDEFRFGVDCRAEFGYGLWQQAYASAQSLTQANVWAAYEAMRQVEADGGVRMGIRPNVLVVPAGQERVGEEALKPILADGSSNTLHGKLRVFSPDYLELKSLVVT